MKTKQGVAATVFVMGLLSGISMVRAEDPAEKTAAEFAKGGEAIMSAFERIAEEQQNGYGLYRRGHALYGKHLKSRSNAEVVCRFSRGDQIKVLAGAAKQANVDVDVRVFSPRGGEIIKDTRENAEAGVRFTAQETGEYRLRLELYKAPTGEEVFCSLMVLENGGQVIAGDKLGDALANQIVGNLMWAAAVATKGGQLRYQRSASGWSLLGAALREDESVKIGVPVEHGLAMVAAFADTNGIDIDLLVSHPLGLWKKEDTDLDAHPVIDFVSSGQDYSVTLSAPDSLGTTMTLTSILHID